MIRVRVFWGKSLAARDRDYRFYEDFGPDYPLVHSICGELAIGPAGAGVVSTALAGAASFQARLGQH